MGVLFLFMLSCKSNYISSEEKLKECTKEKYNASILGVYGDIKGVDFFKHITTIENIFLSEGLIKNNSKEEYLSFIEHRIEELKKEKAVAVINEINNQLKKQGIPKFENVILISGVFKCPIETYYAKNIKDKYPIKMISYSYGTLRDDSYNQNNVLRDMFVLIEKKDFNKITFRSFYILEIYKKLLNKKVAVD